MTGRSPDVFEVLKKTHRVLRDRPLFFPQYVRTYWLFQRTELLVRIARFLGLYPEGIRIGTRAKVQRVRCLRVEQPHAEISLGENGIVYENARIEAYGEGKIQIGPCAVIGDARIYGRSRIQIGARFLSSWNVLIQDYDPHPIDPDLRAEQVERMCGARSSAACTRLGEWDFPVEPISIGDDVWVGANATILKGARIGSGSLIAAGAVVVGGEWPERSLLAGNPAKVVKRL